MLILRIPMVATSGRRHDDGYENKDEDIEFYSLEFEPKDFMIKKGVNWDYTITSKYLQQELQEGCDGKDSMILGIPFFLK